MPTIEALQTLLDISAQHTGTLANVFDIATANGNMSITDELTPGDEMKVNATDENTDKRVLDYYSKNNIQPASCENKTSNPSGIGNMIIEGATNPFKVK